MTAEPARTPLFASGLERALRLTLSDEQALQQLFHANPDYFLATSGQSAGPDTAHQELSGELPAGFGGTEQFVIGFVDPTGELIGMASVVSDLLAEGIWHIGLFMVATSLQRRGLGSRLYQALEAWIAAGGARWIRLGVVTGNHVAERFWARHRFVEVRIRHGVLMGDRSNDVRVLIKPLGTNLLSEYRALVLRDNPSLDQPD